MKRFNSLWETIKEGADEAYESVTDKGEEMFDDMKSSWDIWINEKMNPVHTCAEPVKETEEDVAVSKLSDMIAKERKRIYGIYAPKKSVAHVVDADVRRHYRAVIKKMKKEGRNYVKFSELSTSDKWYRVAIIWMSLSTLVTSVYIAVLDPILGGMMIFVALVLILGEVNLSFRNVNLKRTMLLVLDIFARVKLVGLLIFVIPAIQPMGTLLVASYLVSLFIAMNAIGRRIKEYIIAAPMVVTAARSL